MRRQSRRNQNLTAGMISATVEVSESRQLLAATGVEAVLTGANGSFATAEFKVRDGERNFELVVSKGPIGTHNVLVSGVNVGTITINSAGLGSMEFNENPSDPDEFPFPSNWPGADVGTSVTIGGVASGVMRNKGNDDILASSQFFTLGGTGAQSGSFQFEIETERGVERREFELEVYNLSPSTTYPLIINGTTVATLSSSAAGVVRVRYSDRTRPDATAFPANFPRIDSSSDVRLGTDVVGTPSTRPDDRGTANGVTHLRVALTGDGVASGSASFESTPAQGNVQAKTEFKVEIWNAAPGSVWPVRVAGVTVGSITIGARGFGRLDFETGDDSKPFPGNFPGVSNGTLIEAGTLLSGTVAGSGRIAAPSNQNLVDAYQLDRTLQLTSGGNYFENFGARGEKWIRGKLNQWYFITPDGALYKWDGAAGANGSLVTILDPSFHANPELLYEANAVRDLSLDDDMLRAMAAELDQELNLSTVSTSYDDWGGRGEKWMKGGSSWYFVTPDGTVRKWDGRAGANGTVVASLDGRFHSDPSLLTSAVQNLGNPERAFALDRGLKLVDPPNNFYNWGGRQEKWVVGDGRWYFITPDGKFYRWNGASGANGTLLTTLQTSYYQNTSLLTGASTAGSLAGQAILDDVFVDSPLF